MSLFLKVMGTILMMPFIFVGILKLFIDLYEEMQKSMWSRFIFATFVIGLIIISI